jgi:hypothetical protein
VRIHDQIYAPPGFKRRPAKRWRGFLSTLGAMTLALWAIAKIAVVIDLLWRLLRSLL